MDRLTAARRSWLMSHIGPRNTGPEKRVAAALRRLRLRYRSHRRDLPGTPDFVLHGRDVALFVHGCFWHGHYCKREKMPKTRKDYWLPKIAANRARDARKRRALRRQGWRVGVIWECQTKSRERLLARIWKLTTV